MTYSIRFEQIKFKRKSNDCTNYDIIAKIDENQYLIQSIEIHVIYLLQLEYVEDVKSIK